MKKITQILLLLVIFSAPVKAEMSNMEMTYKTTTSRNDQWGYNYKRYAAESFTTNIVAGQKFKLINIYTNQGNLGISTNCYADFRPENSTNYFLCKDAYEVEGPVVVRLVLPESSEWMTVHAEPNKKSTALFSFEINPNSSLQQSSTTNTTVPTSAVVVPSNAVGDVDVLLEQSNDMITWTQCLPGTYNASTQKRFFRVRAVEK
jgi:hypothetical protein